MNNTFAGFADVLIQAKHYVNQFYALEVVGRDSETQLQVGEIKNNYLWLKNF